MAFREAQENNAGGKFLAYGYEGSGKSWFGLTFPRVACIDSEAGIVFYETKPITLANGNTYQNVVLVDDTSNLDDLESDIDEIMESDNIDTLVIDSETKFYATMQVAATEVEEKKARKKGSDANDAIVSQRQWGRIKIVNMKLQQAKIDLSTKGKNVVSIAQATEIYEGKDDNRKLVGIKPDMHKSVKFDYDVILEFFKTEDTDGVHYYATVKKDRTNVTKVGQVIENPCYDIWKEFFETRKQNDKIQTSYKKDLSNSVKTVESDSEKAETLAKEFKNILKQLKEDKQALLNVNKIIKEKEIDIQNLDIQSPKVLSELIDFAKLQMDMSK